MAIIDSYLIPRPAASKKHEHFASVLMWNNIGNVIEFEANSDIHCNGIPLFSALDNALYCMAIK